MDLVKITDLTNRFGISSRSLRYYEEAGLIKSVRPGLEKYRYYNEAAIERLRQILVLRKMKIPVKDILRIFKSADMSVVVETFVNRIRAIDDEIDALAELRAVVNEFLEAMLQNGVTKISALPILYEQMEKQLETLKSRMMSYNEASAGRDKITEPLNPAIIDLPSMRVLTSYRKDNPLVSEPEGFWRAAEVRAVNAGEPGRHERFEFQADEGDVIFLRVDGDFVNDSEYLDRTFDGGLFAAANVYLDEDVGERFRALVSDFDSNKFYEIDYARPAMLENLISPDEKRELVSLLVPVKKRLPDPALFDKPEEIAPNSVTAGEIETQNPVLWEKDILLNELIPEAEWSYRVNDSDEGAYKPVIDSHYLSTGVKVALPFRVDIEFRVDPSTAAYGYAADEENMGFKHGRNWYWINKNNYAGYRDEAIAFHQPIFGDYYHF